MDPEHNLDIAQNALIDMCFKTLDSINDLENELNQMSARLRILRQELTQTFDSYVNGGYNKLTENFRCD